MRKPGCMNMRKHGCMLFFTSFGVPVLLFFSLGTHDLYIAEKNNTRENFNNSFLFLGRRFCIPPWFGDNCDIKSIHTKCKMNDDRCFFNPVYGVASISCERWRMAQNSEKHVWLGFGINDRAKFHYIGFGNYLAAPTDLGNVAELGAGPSTQTQTIKNKAGKNIKTVTLVEPMAFTYMSKVPHCYYKTGVFSNISTTILSMPAEDLKHEIQFDTVVMINVIEHVYDAFSILHKAISMIKPGGIFIWHERLKRQYNGYHSFTADFKLHPIRIKHIVTTYIMEQFDQLYFANSSQELSRWGYDAVYFIGRRKDKNLPATSLPFHTPCVTKSKGNITVIVILSSEFIENTTKYIKIANDHPNVKNIFLVAKEAFHHKTIKGLLKWSKTTLFLSHQHISNWKKEVSKYLDNNMICQVEQNSLTYDTLSNTNIESLCLS